MRHLNFKENQSLRVRDDAVFTEFQAAIESRTRVFLLCWPLPGALGLGTSPGTTNIISQDLGVATP